MTIIDDIADQADLRGGKKDKGPSQAEILLQLAEEAELFQAPGEQYFADVHVGSRRETHPIRSSGFKRWLRHRFYEFTEGKAPNNDAMASAICVLEARAAFEGDEREVYLRVAGLPDRTYIDLCDKTWRAIEVDADGWRIVDKPPVRFRRTKAMLPLPEPKRGGKLNDLRKFLNCRNIDDFRLTVAWTLMAMRGIGPYPVMPVSAEQGGGKTTLCGVLQRITDPCVRPEPPSPREERDLWITASSAHVLVFGNLSSIPQWLSDGLCRIATGGCYVSRSLYTDADESILPARRPVIVNSIGEVATRGDLVDRCIFVGLDPIPEEKRKHEAEFWVEFNQAAPKILGAICAAISLGIRTMPKVKIDRLPRMADFAMFATACEAAYPDLENPGRKILDVYKENRDSLDERVIEDSDIAQAVMSFIATRSEGTWGGTAAALLDALRANEKNAMTAEQASGEEDSRYRRLPKRPNHLSNDLRKVAPFLRRKKINISWAPRKKDARLISIVDMERSPDKWGDSSSSSSSSSPGKHETNNFNGLGMTMGDDQVTMGDDHGKMIVTPNPLKNKRGDDDDDDDDHFQTLTGERSTPPANGGGHRRQPEPDPFEL